MKKQILSEEFKRMQKLAGLIKEDAFGSKTAIPLSKIPDAAAQAALDGGKKDKNDKDDVAKAGNSSVAVGSLKPMQKEVIPEKALSFALGFAENGQPDLNDMEAITSSDGYIMDGHHRWAARTLLDPGASVTVSKVDMPADDVVTALNVYTKTKGLKGNPGKGDVAQFSSLIPKAIDDFVTNGTDQWPMKGKSPEEIKKIIADKVGGGDFEKGKATLIANAKKLSTKKHPNAPERVEMPVIDAAKGDLKAVLAKLNAGELDFKSPFSPDVSKDLKSGNQKEKEQVAENIESMVNEALAKFRKQKNTNEGIIDSIKGLLGKAKKEAPPKSESGKKIVGMDFDGYYIDEDGNRV